MASKTYCSQPFKEIAIKNFAGDKLQTFWPCCMMGNKLYPKEDSNRLEIVDAHLLTPQEMYDHPRMQQLRDNLSNDIRDPACVVCWHQEDRGLQSYRQFTTPIEGEPGLSTIDLTASNICNLRCRMCSPTASHQLMIDHQYFKQNGLLDRVDNVIRRWIVSTPLETTDSKQWDWLMNNTHQITTLKASGGEPFYDNKVVQLLHRYVETGAAANTSLLFHTNATQFSDEIVNLLNQFKLNKHSFSIDGVDKVYNYIRYPGTFDDLQTSLLNYIHNVKNYHPILNFTVVLTAHNVLNVDDILTWAKTISPAISVHFQEVYPFNRGTSINNLSKELLDKARNQALKHLVRSNGIEDNEVANLIKQISNAIKDGEPNGALIKEECELFDLSRNQSYEDFLHPELVEWLNEK